MVKFSLFLLGSLSLIMVGALFFLRKIWFYRDPVRIPPQDEGCLLAPADGKVVYIKPFSGGQVQVEKLGQVIPVTEITKAPLWGEEGWIIGIYMSPLDVHFNYAPADCRVAHLVYTPAKVNLPMVDWWEYIRLTYLRRAVDLFSHRYRLVNERLTLFLEGRDMRLALVEIADKFVNKIRCFVKVGEELRAGQKISFIERGSQVDLIIFREDIVFTVEVGQQVYGGETVIARYHPSGR
ncbi:phosphatidylserine decarboxylase [Thermanaeromonas toyohensis ToBE]|uniref:Phosphatidylserine decarboxylase n=1 Tax=Thermanaeromonas toyohensis ToBE TaxID=698762 RepID=A0A1W1VG30_9FIRM|nr:phosphatidylserine decarboxylase [Thermanaeromonas toyohensis]SMB92328.1 phosphatidylserine decarboxylase [Thermanaeromonas toyohensis ToBE]